MSEGLDILPSAARDGLLVLISRIDEGMGAVRRFARHIPEVDDFPMPDTTPYKPSPGFRPVPQSGKRKKEKAQRKARRACRNRRR